MGCNCESKSIVLANDSRIESEFNGDAAGYWDQSGNWTKPCGATSLMLFMQILDLEKPRGSSATVRVSLLIQGSIDGKSWGEIATVQTLLYTSAETQVQRVVFPSRLAYAPLVRFGLQISSSTTDGQVAARLSAVVTPLFGDNELVSMQATIAADADTDEVSEATTLDVTGVSTFGGRIAISGFGGNETWTGAIEASFDGENWFEATTLSFAQNGTTTHTISYTGTQLARFLRIVKSGGDASQGTVTVDYLGRAF